MNHLKQAIAMTGCAIVAALIAITLTHGGGGVAQTVTVRPADAVVTTTAPVPPAVPATTVPPPAPTVPPVVASAASVTPQHGIAPAPVVTAPRVAPVTTTPVATSTTDVASATEVPSPELPCVYRDPTNPNASRVGNPYFPGQRPNVSPCTAV